MQSILDSARGSNGERLWITFGSIIAILVLAAILRIITLVVAIWADKLSNMGSLIALVTAGVAVALHATAEGESGISPGKRCS